MIPIWYNSYKDFIEKSINLFLNDYFKNNITNNWLKELKEALFYSIKWWKKIRSVFALEFYLIFSNKKLNELNYNDDIIKFCISLELIHTYSLVHDDLPCMDNDEYRRGQLTTWKKFGEYQAVLLGDLLNSLAFENLSLINNKILWIDLIKLLSKHIWFYWMIWWQVDDMYFENNFWELNIDNLKSLQNKKTGALFKSAIIWWILCSWNTNNIKNYEDLWYKIGLAFQIKDDLLDIEWSFEETWKSVWWENKWFVHFLWLEKTKKYLFELEKSLLNLIIPLKSSKLIFLIEYIIKRKK